MHAKLEMRVSIPYDPGRCRCVETMGSPLSMRNGDKIAHDTVQQHKQRGDYAPPIAKRPSNANDGSLGTKKKVKTNKQTREQPDQQKKSQNKNEKMRRKQRKKRVRNTIANN